MAVWKKKERKGERKRERKGCLGEAVLEFSRLVVGDASRIARKSTLVSLPFSSTHVETPHRAWESSVASGCCGRFHLISWRRPRGGIHVSGKGWDQELFRSIRRISLLRIRRAWMGISAGTGLAPHQCGPLHGELVMKVILWWCVTTFVRQVKVDKRLA